MGGGAFLPDVGKTGRWVCEQDESHYGHVEFRDHLDGTAHEVGGNTGLEKCGQKMSMCQWMTSQGETIEKGISKGFGE